MSMSTANFLTYLPLVGLLIVSLIVVSIRTYHSRGGQSLRTTHFSESEDYIDYTEGCGACFDGIPVCTIFGNPVTGGMDFVQYFSFKNEDGTYNESMVGEMGSDDFTTMYGGFEFKFLNAENKALFISNPSRYAPQWGGFCGWGVAGELCPNYPWSSTCLGPNADFRLWTIQNDKLYFFFKANAKGWFLEDVESNVAVGNERWRQWFGDAFHFSTECYVNSPVEIGEQEVWGTSM
jgi:hypothetical protein